MCERGDFIWVVFHFRPDRWTDDFEEELAEFAYIPFGGGRRTCIGRGFATLEAVVVLATVGQQYRFEWAGDDTAIRIEPEITTRTQDGLPMRIRTIIRYDDYGSTHYGSSETIISVGCKGMHGGEGETG